MLRARRTCPSREGRGRGHHPTGSSSCLVSSHCLGSSRLSAAFSIVFVTGGSIDPKSPKGKTARLPQVGESGDGAKGTGDGAAEAVEKSEDAGTKGSVDQGAVPAVSTVGATALAAVGASTATVAATQEEITQKPKDDSLPAGTAETALSELASVSAPKADEP